jgi:hypothetical protein
MRPKSNTSFCLCLFVSLGSGALLIARFIGWIHVNGFTVAASAVIGGTTTVMLAREYFRRPFVREYSHEDWVITDPQNRKGVFIKIPKSQHGAGNKPHYSFVDRGIHYGKQFEVVDDDGDLTIYHPENSFLPMYKAFVIRIV